MSTPTPPPTAPDRLPQQHDLDALLAVAETVAREAGALVHEGRPERVTVAATKSSPQDVVTAMDVASETLLRRRLAELRPDDGVLGEEGTDHAGTSGVTWVVDPIDGTVNYLYGIDDYAVSVAAVVGDPDPATWTVLVGCVHAPAVGTTYTAARGRGAWRDGVPLQVNADVPLALSLVGTGFGYEAERRRAQGAVVAALLPQVRDVRRIGSAALDLCRLGAGGLDLYYERGLNPWDLAAGQLVAQEAGAVVTGLHGRPPGRDMTVAGPPAGQAELVRLLEGLRADEGA
ncbi:inositol monophosphatase family protein [Cellulomonas marina]|uniref:inositol monophosphatase family protein n=1 Tax=Cellulomonas marina TaxID=988821 RepID=UPI000B7E6C9C|nr:inositol monophosphatase family protein [Cellulomonas marina]